MSMASAIHTWPEMASCNCKCDTEYWPTHAETEQWQCYTHRSDKFYIYYTYLYYMQEEDKKAGIN